MSSAPIPCHTTQEAIASLSFFNTLEAKDITKLVKIARLEQYGSEYLLHYEGSRATRIRFLVSGLAKAYKIDKYGNEIFLYHIQRDTLLSEVSSLDVNGLTSYTNVSILEPTQILSIEYEKFHKTCITTGTLLGKLTEEVLRQSKQLQGIINREFVLDSVSKVAMMLSDDLEIFNRLKRSDVALMLHLQPATLSRVLNRLKRDNLIAINKGDITLIDSERLQNLYKDTV